MEIFNMKVELYKHNTHIELLESIVISEEHPHTDKQDDQEMGDANPSGENTYDHDSNATDDENPSNEECRQYLAYLKSTRQDLNDKNNNHHGFVSSKDNQTLILEKLSLLIKQFKDLQNENA